jgi:hypothetical protein
MTRDGSVAVGTTRPRQLTDGQQSNGSELSFARHDKKRVRNLTYISVGIVPIMSPESPYNVSQSSLVSLPLPQKSSNLES